MEMLIDNVISHSLPERVWNHWVQVRRVPTVWSLTSVVWREGMKE